MRSNKAAERLQVSGHGPPPSGTKRAGAARIASAGSRRAARATGARDSAWARHWFTTRATAPTARSAAEAPVAPRRRSFFSSLSRAPRCLLLSRSLARASRQAAALFAPSPSPSLLWCTARVAPLTRNRARLSTAPFDRTSPAHSDSREAASKSALRRLCLSRS